MSTAQPDDEPASSPLTMSFDVECSVEHAFTTWTQRIASWWPRDHTVTGAHNTDVVLQQQLGGRIFERAPDGVEHLWGHVTAWEPPHRLAYVWHLGREPADATEVEITFAPRGRTATAVRIEHRGWQRLGTTAGVWRERNRAGWDSLLPHYRTAAEAAPRTGGT